MRKLTLIIGVAALALLASSCQKLKSRDQLNKGVQAFKNAQYADAVESFKTAVELDPNFPTARLYLATATCSSTFRVRNRLRTTAWRRLPTTSS